MSSNSLIFPSTIPNLLLIPPNVFFILDIVVFMSRISIWVIFYLLCLTLACSSFVGHTELYSYNSCFSGLVYQFYLCSFLSCITNIQLREAFADLYSSPCSFLLLLCPVNSSFLGPFKLSILSPQLRETARYYLGFPLPVLQPANISQLSAGAPMGLTSSFSQGPLP